MDIPCFPLFFFFFFLILGAFCQCKDQLTQVNPLSPGDMLVSEGGDFALGFFSPNNSNKSLYLGIWYHNIPERTVVWVANRDSPVTDHSSTKLAVTNSPEVVLSGSKGDIIWTTANTTITGGAGAFAVLLNSGNFVLRLLNGTQVWQSFDHPTDTLLPTMRFVLSYKGQVTRRLTAWKGLDDPSTGDFSYSLDPSSHPQDLIWHNTSPYCRTNVFRDMSVGGGIYQNSATWVLYLTRVRTEDEVDLTYSVSSDAPYTRFWIGYTGKLRFQSWDNNTLSWTTIDEAPSSCDLYVSCGPFGYCDFTEALPTCRCFDGFEPIDKFNSSKGCQRNGDLKCQEANHFATLSGMNVPDKFLHIRNRSFDQCVAECQRNCSCTAYAYADMSGAGTTADTSRCLIWAGDLFDTRKDSSGENLYLRLADAETTPVSKKKSTVLKIVVPSMATFFLLITCVWLVLKARVKRQSRKVQKNQLCLNPSNELGNESLEFPSVSFEDIITATNNFSDYKMLGKGGFGKVYKGMLEGGKEVAVKRLSKGSKQGIQEFRNEVILIAKLQHRNLVRLLGFCIHEDEKLLIYEFLSNKSLDAFLFDATRKLSFDWRTRFKIIKGVARGLLYLHQDSRLTIIHRDLKASNILLDTNMCPKISDFGMARIFGGSEQQANTTRVVGTYSYMAPEYAMEGSFSVKSDTYSFGVLLLEIVSGLKISSPHLIMNFPNLIAYAWSLWRDGNGREFVDLSISESCSFQEAIRCIHLGLLCVQDHPNARPLMSSIVFMLENETTPLPSPKEPLYFTIRNDEADRSNEYMERSLNNMSISTLVAR